MFENEARINLAVWVRIGKGENAPLVPGIITDARVVTRDLLRSVAKGGTLSVQNSVVVISLRENMTPANGRPATYYVERPEALIALSRRTTMIPAIDGTAEMSQHQIVDTLRMQVALSRAALAPAPSSGRVEEEAARYLSLPALGL